MWLDNASEVDILFYEPYANVIADISKNPNYKPLTIGVFGVWGAGKSTLLKLIEQKIDEDSEGKGKTLCININAWTFEGYEDAKIALMEALLREIKEHKDIPSRVKNGVSKLLKKLDFFKLATKAVSVGAPMIASVATGNPIPLLLSVSGKAEDVGNGIKSVADAMQSIRDDYLKDEESDDANSIVNNVRKFRKEFKEALRDDGVENVIVLIDDLDRCQPDRIIETLEAIKLFLSVEKMTFIIAADENVIQYAIRKKYPPIENYSVNLDKEYIEKIIQLPIYIPELSSKDIENYLMLQHFYCENGFLQEEVVGTRNYNLQQSYSCAERVNLFSDDYTGNIQSVLFEGVKRGVFSAAKFDSRPELVLARVLETDTDVQNWLRPAPQEFNITYNHGHNYEPDFVVETDDTIYLVEVKGEDKLSDPDVIAKKKRGIQYCKVASRWGKANGYKQWRYLFIPSKQVMPNSSFMQLAKRFEMQ